MNMQELIKAHADLTERVVSLEAQVAELSKPRDRGPTSERTMTEADAFRVKFGDLKDAKPKDAAAATGLSYGQVFSARGGYTFKRVTKDWKAPAAAEVKTEVQPEVEVPAETK